MVDSPAKYRIYLSLMGRQTTRFLLSWEHYTQDLHQPAGNKVAAFLQKEAYIAKDTLLNVSLEDYRSKRDFTRTPEPLGDVEPSEWRRFVIQEHHARSLHWDLRLEHNGVLKSWAVPKGPPEKSGVRRLAIQTKDHPIAYIDFEARIPDGEYGAGIVRIWDRGEYQTEKWKDGEVIINLEGSQLKGRYCLIRMRGQLGKWLLFRCARDERKG